MTRPAGSFVGDEKGEVSSSGWIVEPWLLFAKVSNLGIRFLIFWQRHWPQVSKFRRRVGLVGLRLETRATPYVLTCEGKCCPSPRADTYWL